MSVTFKTLHTIYTIIVSHNIILCYVCIYHKTAGCYTLFIVLTWQSSQNLYQTCMSTKLITNGVLYIVRDVDNVMTC